jgi:hypothetical protein
MLTHYSCNTYIYMAIPRLHTIQAGEGQPTHIQVQQPMQQADRYPVLLHAVRARKHGIEMGGAPLYTGLPLKCGTGRGGYIHAQPSLPDTH